MRLNNAGDTIVEVLFSTVILATVLAGAFTLTNKATRINQASVERTEVANVMQEQVELLKAYILANDPVSSGDITNKIIDDSLATSIMSASNVHCSYDSTTPKFYMTITDHDANPATLSIASIKDEAPLRSGDFYNVWIEVASNDDAVSKIRRLTYTVRACWETIGETPTASSGLVYQTYEELP